MILAKIDDAQGIAREFLTQTAENPERLAAFESSLEGLRKSSQEIRSEVQAHAERLHNVGKLPADRVIGFRAELESYALGHRERMLTVLEAAYTNPKAEGEFAARLGKLRGAIAMERARRV